jgi:hypothetical protein
MIVTWLGSEIEITGDCGEHPIEGHVAPVHVLWVRYQDSGIQTYVGLHNLKATGGLAEILAARDQAPKINLSAAELRKIARRYF